jgi:hypothetical protein
MRIRRLIRAEDGAILVAATVAMVALIGMGAVVVQVASWYQNRHHLQMRADAGALAGAQLFNECFLPSTAGISHAQAQTDIQNWAKRYAGFASPVGAAENTQFGVGTTDFAFQSQTYPGGGGPGADDTYVANTNVCESQNIQAPHGGIDLKLRHQSIRRLFSFAPFANVYAHARVQLKEIQSIVPTFPLAVPELVPNAVAVTFINEDTGAELTGCTGAVVTGTTCTYKLTNPNAGTGTDPYNLGPWTISNAGVNLPSFSGTSPLVTHIGMRIGIGDPSAVQSCRNSGGNGTNWVCFNNSILGQGTIAIDDVNPSAAIAAPRLQGLWPSTCSGSPFDGDDSFNPCWATVTAKVVSTGLSNFRMRAKITQNGGATQTSPLMTFNAGTGLYTAPTTWATVNVNPTTGASDYTVSLCWGSGGGNATNNCPAAWTHRVVGATDTDDGPLDAVSLSDPGATVSPYSYNTSGIHTLGISVLLKAPFNKLTILRQSHDGSATAFILCRWKNNTPPAIENGLPGITDALAEGCQVPYQINSTLSCSPDPLPSPANQFNPDCTQNKPSSSMGNQITNSLDTRFGCVKNKTPVHPNLWPNYSTPGDTRAVTLITTTFDAFAHNGSEAYPVAGFGAFYIAGVSGNACGDAWPAVLGPEPNKNSGTIWGYFIKYTNLDGTPSGRACQVNSLNNCVAVLTR